MPEEPAELQSLLLTQRQDIVPPNAGGVQFIPPRFPNVFEPTLHEKLFHLLVGQIGEQGRVPNRVSHLLAERALEEVWTLGQKKHRERSRTTERSIIAFVCWASEQRPQLPQHPEQGGLADATGSHDQATLSGIHPQADVPHQAPHAIGSVDVHVLEAHVIGVRKRHDSATMQLLHTVVGQAAENLLLVDEEPVCPTQGALLLAMTLEDDEGIHDL
mmetsp:Transcript_63477/g.148721  ORF Transcript_63477/g.148721 Transcript_63477/m.148721 type:complete len:216 (-) Transcript_63477:1173-1820(-)